MPDVEDLESMYVYDQYISELVILPKYYGFSRALVTRQTQGLDRNIIVPRHSNPLLDTCILKVQFQDGSISEYAVNLIAENLYSLTYTGGNEFLLLNDILDHISTNKTVKTAYTFKVDPSKRKYKKTMAGWELLVEWADKTHPQSWIYLKDIKELYPIQDEDYANAKGILGQPAFFL